MVVRKGEPCPLVEHGEMCGKAVLGREMCSMHYARWKTYGDPLHPVRPRMPNGTTCTACGERATRRGLCDRCRRRADKHGTTMEPRERRFWAKVNKNGPVPENRPDLGPCWVWTGYVDPKTGYGQFGSKGKGTNLPHRIAYQYLVGPIGKGLHLDHVCRNRLCVNAANGHLEPVTPRENIRRGDQGAFWGYVPDLIPPKAPKPTVCTECARPDRPVFKSGRCRPCYRKWLKDPTVVRPSQMTAAERFWAKVNKNGPVPEHKPELGPCWIWTASINQKTGYGRFAVRHGEMVDAHRFSYLLAHESIPEKHDVHHDCHRRSCVAPHHLLATTRSENLKLRKYRRA